MNTTTLSQLNIHRVYFKFLPKGRRKGWEGGGANGCAMTLTLRGKGADTL